MTAGGSKARAWIGTSGYQYDHWRGVLYPPEAPKRRWFDLYAARFDTVEINNTFYGLPEAETFDRWRRAAPPGFCFALKFSRYATHLRRLRGAEGPRGTIATFLARARRLGPALGPILVQLPPRWRADPARLDAFLAAAPADCRWAVEFRDPSWLIEPVFEVLRRRGAALVVHDLLPNHPLVATADWVYLRFHGTSTVTRYGGNYSAQALSAVARRIRRHLAEGRDVYAYFNNDAGGCAVRDALALKRYLLGAGQGPAFAEP